MSQVNFYQLEADEEAFLDYLAQRGDTGFLVKKFHETPTPAFVQRDALPRAFGERRFVLVNVNLRPRLRLIRRGGGDYEGMYLPDMDLEPTIDLDRCFYDEGVLRRGRIYAKFGRLADAEENTEYARWYRSIERWLKRRYTRVGGYRWFAPKALQYGRQGGAMVPSFETIEASKDRP